MSAAFGVPGVVARFGYYEADRDRMRHDLCRKRGLPVGSGVVESACKQIVGSRFKRATAPCSPPIAASQTAVGPTSSIGGLAAPQPPDLKNLAPPCGVGGQTIAWRGICILGRRINDAELDDRGRVRDRSRGGG